MNKTQDMGQRARARIPGGTQLLSKRPEMFAPGQWPGYYSRAKGAEVWDLDGRRYVDMSMMGIGANILGFADPDVDAAAKAAIDAGVSCTLNCPEEVELADLLCEIHPWAEQVRYARTGGEAMAVAVRIARASTGRDKVAFCGYHGWHDWYLAANLGSGDRLEAHLLPGLEPAGVPRALAGTALPFRFNHPEELESILRSNKSQVGAVVLEPARTREPAPGFLRRVRELAHEAGAVLVYDEVSSGLRMTHGGIHLLYDTPPDIAVFAKSLGNGYPIAAIIGRREIMGAAQTTFISSTNWTERVGFAAGLATLRKHRERRVADHLVATGTAVQQGWRAAARKADLEAHVDGIPPLSHIGFGGPDGLAVTTLFTQLMLEKGFLASAGFYASYAHTPADVNAYLDATQGAFFELSEGVAKGQVADRLKGPVRHSGFRRLA